ncbi:modification methylase EcoRI family protein [Capnocytophaga ochracea F0287]|jgi:modification methylase ecoRI|uniref:Adenine-specific methyltransferase EcoRI family protein n=2 Tax=Capnocytophaga ochracea TaxID=1018 RepID=A0A2X2RGG4_CAPOC|nr:MULTISPECIES: adenine-specific methyltransferase EcoRI family protein [Capnocytophaga]EFS96650.1 modification methylase EcoRI family protein [Capnocytophaga ochracea F0287]EJF43792.1 adenine-specific methyltransferase EcoRI [Capnocytophaga ochracea str. Holt 25]QLF50427.1 adenine-specific methyltransferase EcoRI family protein [Capnocytophaga sp. oral taxon 902]UEB42693.1 adenine-specific methyltransferase EcoRI family protein [Capnocytophaga ochracea]UZD39838.1 adenine-specific methyltrans
MARKATNNLLQKAKKLKNDEFYTQIQDIERELQYYKNHFEGKIVYCNCDDPYTSNFFKYFVSNFKELKLKKVIASCFKEQTPNLFSTKEIGKAFFAEYEGEKIAVSYFKGDGDFRSAECIALLKQSDIVVTNPPFSLFREYVAQLVKYDKKFLIIGNINAITYKEIFKLIQENKAWLGVHLGRGISGFIVPEHYELYGTETQIDTLGNRIVSPNNCLWLTNLDNFKRHEEIVLTKRYLGNENNYPQYDNYNGIHIDKTENIPSDYTGYMGVPITFLHKFNPNQFEIVKFRKGDDEKDLSINGKYPYFRILVRNKRYSLVNC